MDVHGIVLLLVVVGCVVVVKAHPTGPPDSVCTSMTPDQGAHGTAQETPSPYTVTPSHSTYMPNDMITVTLSSPNNSSFTGVFVQARMKGGQNKNPQGTFMLNDGESQLRLMDCGNIDNSAVSHNSRDPKTNKIIIWKAPSDGVGDIHFMVTFVQERYIFWEGVVSEDVVSATNTSTPSGTTGSVTKATDKSAATSMRMIINSSVLNIQDCHTLIVGLTVGFGEALCVMVIVIVILLVRRHRRLKAWLSRYAEGSVLHNTNSNGNMSAVGVGHSFENAVSSSSAGHSRPYNRPGPRVRVEAETDLQGTYLHPVPSDDHNSLNINDDVRASSESPYNYDTGRLYERANTLDTSEIRLYTTLRQT